MKIQDDDILDFKIYIVISNCNRIQKCFGNEENAYLYATQECFNQIEEKENNKHIFEMIYNADSDLDADYTTKLKIIHDNFNDLIKSERHYHHLVYVEEYILDTEDIYI